MATVRGPAKGIIVFSCPSLAEYSLMKLEPIELTSTNYALAKAGTLRLSLAITGVDEDAYANLSSSAGFIYLNKTSANPAVVQQLQIDTVEIASGDWTGVLAGDKILAGTVTESEEGIYSVEDLAVNTGFVKFNKTGANPAVTQIATLDTVEISTGNWSGVLDGSKFLKCTLSESSGDYSIDDLAVTTGFVKLAKQSASDTALPTIATTTIGASDWAGVLAGSKTLTGTVSGTEGAYILTLVVTP